MYSKLREAWLAKGPTGANHKNYWARQAYKMTPTCAKHSCGGGGPLYLGALHHLHDGRGWLLSCRLDLSVALLGGLHKGSGLCLLLHSQDGLGQGCLHVGAGGAHGAAGAPEHRDVLHGSFRLHGCKANSSTVRGCIQPAQLTFSLSACPEQAHSVFCRWVNVMHTSGWGTMNFAASRMVVEVQHSKRCRDNDTAWGPPKLTATNMSRQREHFWVLRILILH